MTDHVMVVRLGAQYLQDRYHHGTWTKRLSQARTWLTREGAEKAALTYGGEPVLVELSELKETELE